MDIAFETVHNHYEDAVFGLVCTMATEYPGLKTIPGLHADVACIALNSLPPRYIRHQIDLAFYTTDVERMDTATALNAAVRYAFELIKSRALLPPARQNR